jgi:hypothetical protein
MSGEDDKKKKKDKDSKSLASFFGDLFRPLQFAVACLSLL